MQPLSIGSWMPVDALRRWEMNPRDNDAAIAPVAESIRRFGFVSPIVVWTSADRMVAGDTRLKAMRMLLASDPTFTPKGAPGPGLVPVRFHEFESEREADLYAVADNALGEIAKWNEPGLKAIVERHHYTQEEVHVARFEEHLPKPPPPALNADTVPEPPKVAVTQPGDVWVLGGHRILCGDSTDAAAVAHLMGDVRADMMWTDPPYGVSYVGGNHSKTAQERRDAGGLEIKNDALTPEELEAFLTRAFDAAGKYGIVPGGSVYVAHPQGALSFAFASAFRTIGWRIHQTLIWVKDSMVLGRSDYHYIHEPILLGYTPSPAGTGRHGRGGTGWWGDNSQVSVFNVARPKVSKEHPTMKPPELIVPMVSNSSPPGGIVLDLFMGSGSTLVAAEQTERRSFGMELDPRFCDVIVERWQRLTGKKAKRQKA